LQNIREGEKDIVEQQVLDNIEMLGVESFGDSSIELKFRVKTKTLQQWAVKRELHKIIKK
jgi:small conductance mechanosensitive channel